MMIHHLLAISLVLGLPEGVGATELSAGESSMLIRLIQDGSGDPIAHGVILAEHDFEDIELHANESGVVELHLPDDVTFLRLWAKAPGHSTMVQYWRYELGGLKLPAEFSFPMPVGTRVGGVVTNERGDPVEDVTVRVQCWLSRVPQRVMIRGHEVRTGADGRWTCDVIPAEATWIGLSLHHRDYVQEDYRTTTDETGDAMERYRRLEGVNVLRTGVTVWGRVVTEAGEAIEGADVQVGRFSEGYTRSIAATDAEGVFRFTTERDDLVVMVRADHLSPQMINLPKDRIESPIEVVLKRGGLIRGRVTDPAGAPIGGAELRVMWAGSSQDWSIRTDRNGEFEWDAAPLDGDIELDVAKGGYVKKGRFAVRPGKDYEVTLPEALVIRGQVVDAKTREPMSEFRVTPAFEQHPTLPLFYATSSAIDGEDGAFAIAIDDEHKGVYLVVEAEGHLPVKSRRFEFDEGERQWNAALEVGVGPTAVVRDAAGAVVVGASVHRTTLTSCLVIDGESFYGNTTESTTTDESGRFAFSPALDPTAIIVLTDEGYATVTDAQLRELSEISLQPWSKIRGRYVIGDNPAGEQNIEMASFANAYDNRPGFLFQSSVTTDRRGLFTLDRAPAGLVEIKHLLPKRRTIGVTVQREVVDLAPGETRDVQLGGRGRAVIGRLIPPAGLVPTQTWTYAGFAILKTPYIDWPYPEEYATWTHEEQESWWHAWRMTDECDAVLERRFRESRAYHFDLSPDGTFRVEDVLPGSSVLWVQVVDPESLLTGVFGDPLGVIDTEVLVPEMADSASPREPFDLGPFELALTTKVQIGAAAPDFEFATVDGEKMELSDFRGRYVLLDFWATWCRPCVEELPHIKAVYDRYHNKGLEVVGLSLDVGPEAPRSLFERRGYRWTQGFLGKDETVVTRTYGVAGIPAIILIDPEGRVLARDLRGSAIGDAVAEALDEVE